MKGTMNEEKFLDMITKMLQDYVQAGLLSQPAAELLRNRIEHIEIENLDYTETKNPEMKCHFCGTEAADVEPLVFRDKKTPPTCPSCLKKALLYFLAAQQFLGEVCK